MGRNNTSPYLRIEVLSLAITERSSKGSGVAFDRATGGDFLQQPPHDLPLRVLRSASLKRMLSGFAREPISLATQVVAIFVASATVEGSMVEAARKMVKDFPRPPLEGIAVPGGAAEVAGSYS